MHPIRDFIHKLTQPKNSTNFVGRESFRTSNPYVLGCYDQDSYASIYPSVKAIANEFMKIRPKATGANGEPVEKFPALDALYHPNQLDSSVAFREKIAVMNLTHRNTYILVWRKEGNEAKPGGDFGFKGARIAGYTFLENPGLEIIDGRTYYNMGAQRFSDKEVIVIPGGVDPYNLYQGYAPGIASKKWATLDDYIADFNKGHLENGAVPAGQFLITASSSQDYNDTVDKLQAAHRGASKTNNVTYTPRPIDPVSGKPGESKIEWIPFGQTNKENDFKTLFEQANNRIDSTFGVPASIRGVGENNNYATARIDQQNFIRFTIEPLALRIYTQITHELNRITGGLGVAITFDIEYPAIADEEKVQAETKQVEVATILTLTDRGFSLDSIVDALELSNAYKTLAIGDLKTSIKNDKADVDEGDEVEDSPNPAEIDGVTPLNEVAKGTNPKAELTDEQKLEVVARRYMQRQIDRVIEENREETEVTNEVLPAPEQSEIDEFAEEAYKIILTILVAEGTLSYVEALAQAKATGIDVDDLSPYFTTESVQDRYRAYLKMVGTSYGNDTAESIRRVLGDANDNSLTRRELEENLRNILNTDDYRVKRLARTEINHSTSIAKIEAFEQMAELTGTQWEKGLLHTLTPEDEYCLATIDQYVPIAEPYLAYGSSIIGTEGGILVNNFVDNPGYGIHPNCRGIPVFRRVGTN